MSATGSDETPAWPRPGAGPWREFVAQGALADLQALDVIARAIRWLVTGTEADGLRGKVVMAQQEVRARQLLERWPAPVSQDRPWET